MADVPRISGAEWEVMNAIWEDHPISAQDVVDATAERRTWNLQTVKTLLARLVKKDVLAFERDGKRYLYRPLVTRERCVRAESDSFLDRVFGGSTSPLLAHFLRQGKLSQDEIDELRDLLRDQEPGS